MIKKYFINALTALLCISLAGCFPRKSAEQVHNIKNEKYVFIDSMPDPKKPITILIHGTRLPALLLFALPPLAACVVTPPGFHHANAVGIQYAFSHMAETFDQEDHDQFPLENFYLFGWSGELSFKARRKAGGQVYRFLRKIRDLPEYKNTPITVITISHGGNVALSVPVEAAKEHYEGVLADRLVLLCCPVQEATEKCASSSVFKKVFNIFSPGDMVQVMDPQGLYPAYETDRAKEVFSHRTFSAPAITQVEVCHRGRALSHVDFAMSNFQKCLPRLLKTVEQKSQSGCSPVKIDLHEFKKRLKK